jgi:hypothetical protein
MEFLAMLYNSNQKQKKGIFFVVDEEQQLCCSFLHVSQDLVINNEQKFAMLWDRVK